MDREQNNEIVEGNKLIAIAMGYTYFPHNHPDLKSPGEAGWKTKVNASNLGKFNAQSLPYGTGLGRRAYLCRHHNSLPYDNDWNALINALQAICQESGAAFIICSRYVGITYSTLNGKFATDFISEALNENQRLMRCTWKVLVKFIKILNENKEAKEAEQVLPS